MGEFTTKSRIVVMLVALAFCLPVCAHAQFNSTEVILFDSFGNLWVANGGNNTLTVFGDLGAPGGQLLQTISNSAISRPLGLAVDAYGDFYVADNSNNSVVAFNIDD